MAESQRLVVPAVAALALLMAGCASPAAGGGPPGDGDAASAFGPPGPLAGALPGAAGGPGLTGAGQPHVEEYALDVGGQRAWGLLGVPSGEPTTLVVLAHAWGASAETHRHHLQDLAGRGVLAVAMDFRGPSDAFKVRSGVEDTVAATLDLQAKHPDVDRTLVVGHSMGGEVALLAAATAPPGTYDHVFAGAGVADLAALWRTYVTARPAIERETGGTPSQVPDEYAARSPLDHMAALRANGVERFFLVHGAGDAPVPVEHAERLYEAMWEADLEVSFYVVTVDHGPEWCLPETGLCPAPMPAAHSAGRLELMRPFLDHRIARHPDPWGAVRGTYDGDAGTYDPATWALSAASSARRWASRPTARSCTTTVPSRGP